MKFADLENSDDSTIFSNFQFNKYANLICKLFIKVLIFKIWMEIRPAIVNFKNYAFVCPNDLFKLKLTLIHVYSIKFINL